MSDRPPSKFASYFGGIGHALSVRDYRVYWIGQMISVQGIWIWRVSSGVLIYQLTQSPAWLGTLSLAFFGPLMAVGPIAGAIADSMGHRRTAIVSIWVTILVTAGMAVLTATHLMTPVLLAVLTGVLGIGSAFDFPARQVLVQYLVGRERMSAAIALNSTTFNVGVFTGPAIGAALLAWSKPWAGDAAPAIGFAVYSLTSTCFMLSLVFIRARDAARKEMSLARVAADVKDGMLYIAEHRTIRQVMGGWLVISFLMRSYVDLLPGFAADVFHRGSDGLGILLSSGGIGSLVLAIFMAVRGRSRGMPRLYVVSAVIGALAILTFSLTAIFTVASACMMVAGAFIITASICAQTIVQATVDLNFRGRVLAVYLSIVPSAQSVGSFCIGWGAEYIGLPHAMASAIGLALLMIALTAPQIWKRGRSIEDEMLNNVSQTSGPRARA